MPDAILPEANLHQLSVRVLMIDAIGGQMGLDCVKAEYEERKSMCSPDKENQSFGWDPAYHPNPRLSFQKGMLAYPFRKEEDVKIKKDGPSWFVKCLRADPNDPFHLGPMKDRLRPVMIRLPEKSVGHCLEYIQDIRGLTPPRVYLDYGRIGDRLQLEES